MSTYIIAELGVNHNGDIGIAKKMIDTALIAGCNAVKFQKRTIEKVYTKEYLDSELESPWGNTVREEKEHLEFGQEEYDEIERYCKKKGIEWFASAWDVEAQKFLQQYNFKHNKVPSVMLRNDTLLEMIAKEGKYTFIATGMSSFEEIDHAVEIFRKYDCPFELMHCNSTYPMPSRDANLKLIDVMRNRYRCKVGYSGHELGTLVSACAVAMGATSIERHVTLDKNMYGINQKSAIQPYELWKLVQDIRDTEMIIGTGEKVLTSAEQEMKEWAGRIKNDFL
ncbi:N-acetylneuraminate synthase family protein [Velocimicrobium porci]|uniref:N-acetylneuraminate synthase n=1 Tax=Velocimicrobium porci TaxID=2606634 RepID=A0A6L5Y070_9FIRM|nr:N-acetylneuraminate synthase family protein [Velocimicrobium porci]MSS64520.1 N-acetylneuraminate synthase [Velocimicrobium porci]